MTLDEKLDKLLKDQEYTNKLLETIVEGMPAAGASEKRMKALMKPLLENPMIAGNPALMQMLSSFMPTGGE